MAIVFLTAKRISPSKNVDLTQPQMLMLQTENIVKTKPFKNGLSVLYGTSVRPWKKYRVAETASDFNNAVRLASGVTADGDAQNNLAASGTTQATALPVGGVTAYYNAVTVATAASAGIILPPASTKFANGGAFVIKNAASVAISVYPAVSEFIDNGASNAPVTCGVLQRLHFYASASNTWKSASVYA